ncbi:DUF3604 domain-containing protein [Albimonas sp. CAU 1670]|uniref:DUF3604 domain-containing protein n=1 Tax=Albimonas sp. CAU 1670 TaxID=3032599 RepID=UPI0023DA7311|nr:DUF3604 domain-containing protein [Albimonas sp. CAU 1670]MDF2233803.1 DUF3604 domain-containing protein [Albimonas sp. CAU 1670]
MRVFAGQGIAERCDSCDAIAADGYAKGLPMGGDDAGTEAPQSPVWAMKDPIGPNLDRIQIVMGRVENSKRHDAIFDVVASGDRRQADGTVTPIDAPIDLATGAFGAERGDPEWVGVLTDPDRNRDQQAFRNVRALPLPTAGWTLYDEINAGATYPPEVKREIVERAWVSPIRHVLN